MYNATRRWRRFEESFWAWLSVDVDVAVALLEFLPGRKSGRLLWRWQTAWCRRQYRARWKVSKDGCSRDAEVDQSTDMTGNLINWRIDWHSKMLFSVRQGLIVLCCLWMRSWSLNDRVIVPLFYCWNLSITTPNSRKVFRSKPTSASSTTGS